MTAQGIWISTHNHWVSRPSVFWTTEMGQDGCLGKLFAAYEWFREAAINKNTCLPTIVRNKTQMRPRRSGTSWKKQLGLISDISTFLKDKLSTIWTDLSRSRLCLPTCRIFGRYLPRKKDCGPIGLFKLSTFWRFCLQPRPARPLRWPASSGEN